MRHRLIISYAAALHAVWALALIFGPDQMITTTLAHLIELPRPLLILLLLTVTVSASWALTLAPPGTLKQLVALLPQQMTLLVSAGSALEAMIGSHFADGVIRPRAFIVADQAPALIAAIFHTAALLDEYRRRWR